MVTTGFGQEEAGLGDNDVILRWKGLFGSNHAALPELSQLAQDR